MVEANRRLGLSDEVPLDVPAVIGKANEAVAAPAREDAFADPYLLESLADGLVRIGLEQIRHERTVR